MQDSTLFFFCSLVKRRGSQRAETLFMLRYAWRISSIDAWRISSIDAWRISSIDAWRISSIDAWRISSIDAWRISSIDAWRISSVDAWRISSIDATLSPLSPPYRGLTVMCRCCRTTFFTFVTLSSVTTKCGCPSRN